MAGPFDDLPSDPPAAQAPAGGLPTIFDMQPETPFARSLMGMVSGKPAPVVHPAFADLPDAVNPGVAFGRSFANNVPIIGPLADYGDAALAATFPHAGDYQDASNSSWGSRYGVALAHQRTLDAQGAHDAPWASGTGGVAGFVGGAVAGGSALSPVSRALGNAMPDAGMLPTMAANGVDGALLGGATGYLSGNGGWGDPSRLQGAATDALMGGAGGLAVQPVMKAGKAVWNATGRKIADALHGDVKVGGAPAQIDPFAANLARQLSSETAQGAPQQGVPLWAQMSQQPHAPPPRAVPHSAPQPALNRADALAAIQGAPQISAPPPPGSTAAPVAPSADLADALAASNAVPSLSVPPSALSGAYDRIYRAASRGSSDPTGIFGQAEKLGTFGMPVDASVPMQDFGRAVASTPGQAGQIAWDSLNLRQIGQTDQGQYTVRPSSLRIGGSIAQGLGTTGQQPSTLTDSLIAAQKAASTPAYAAAYAHPAVDIGEFRDFSSSPTFQNAYDRARAISQNEFVPQSDGSQQLQPLPQSWTSQPLDWRTLDLMKQGMQDNIRENNVAGIGANANGALKNYLGAFTSKLDGLNPDYATARAAFSGPASAMDAIDAGKAYMSESADGGVTGQLADLSPGDQHMYRVGAVQAVQKALGDVPTTNDAARIAGVNTPNKMAKLQQLFPDQKTYSDYYQGLQNEKTMFDTRTRVLGGSTTARNLAGDQDAGEDPIETAGLSLAALHGDHGAMGTLLSRVLKAGNGQQMSEPIANAAASIMFNPNKGAYPDFLAGMNEAAKRAALAKALGGSPPPAAAAGAINLANVLNPQGSNP